MKIEKKLFLFGVVGILFSFVYCIVASYIVFSYWSGYIYGDTEYCYLLGRYSEEIVWLSVTLFWSFIGFTIGIGSIMLANRRNI